MGVVIQLPLYSNWDQHTPPILSDPLAAPRVIAPPHLLLSSIKHNFTRRKSQEIISQPLSWTTTSFAFQHPTSE